MPFTSLLSISPADFEMILLKAVQEVYFPCQLLKLALEAMKNKWEANLFDECDIRYYFTEISPKSFGDI